MNYLFLNANYAFFMFVPASSSLSGLLVTDEAKGAIRDHESTRSLTPPGSALPSLDHSNNEVCFSELEYEPVP